MVFDRSESRDSGPGHLLVPCLDIIDVKADEDAAS